jgi:hypothetical protein
MPKLVSDNVPPLATLVEPSVPVPRKVPCIQVIDALSEPPVP